MFVPGNHLEPSLLYMSKAGYASEAPSRNGLPGINTSLFRSFLTYEEIGFATLAPEVLFTTLLFLGTYK